MMKRKSKASKYIQYLQDHRNNKPQRLMHRIFKTGHTLDVEVCDTSDDVGVAHGDVVFFSIHGGVNGHYAQQSVYLTEDEALELGKWLVDTFS